MRILLLSNIPTPYQCDFWEAVAEKAEVRAVFLWAKEENRDWSAAYPSWVQVLNYQDEPSGWETLKTILDEYKPDVLVVGGYRLPLAHRVRWYALSRRLRFFYWLEKPLPGGLAKKIVRFFACLLTLPHANGVLCIGSESERFYRRFSRKTLNLPYAIKFSRYPLRSQQPATLPLRFLFVGQYIPRKGVAELLEAFSTITPTSAMLSLVGSGELKALVSNYTQRFSHIRELGFVEPDKLPQLFSEHDVFILPSRHDGWAVVIAEALAAGLPVIGTLATGAFVDLAAGRAWGRTCEVNAASIQQAVEYYISKASEVRAVGAKGREALAQSPAIADNAARALLGFVG